MRSASEMCCMYVRKYVCIYIRMWATIAMTMFSAPTTMLALNTYSTTYPRAEQSSTMRNERQGECTALYTRTYKHLSIGINMESIMEVSCAFA